jgi:hypothetical protein
MGTSCRDVTFITVTCDLCRTTEHRSHEVTRSGDMGALLRQQEGRAIETLPAGWSITTGTKRDDNASRFVCPACVRDVEGHVKKIHSELVR